MPKPSMERDGPDPGSAAAAALKAAVPTSRHAESVFDSVLADLGDAAVVQSANGDQLRTVFRRDPESSGWLIPWPMLRLSVGRRLAYVQGAEGPPTDEAPPGRPGSSPRLRGLAAGELEFGDGRSHLSTTYGQDGLQCETSRGGPDSWFRAVTAALRRGGRSGVEALADFIVTVDPGAGGPARVFFPTSASIGVEGSLLVAQRGIRDALFDGKVASNATWIAADGVAGVVVCTGASREEAFTACSQEIERVRPAPPEPTPMPNFSEETRARLEEDGFHVLHGPTLDVPRVKPTPDQVPIAVVALAPVTAEGSPLGEWLRLVGDRGEASVAAHRRDERGSLIITSDALARIDLRDLDAQLDAADTEWESRCHGMEPSFWPPELPPLRVAVSSYRLESSAPGIVRVIRTRGGTYIEFQGRQIRPEEFEGGIFRQRWVS